MTSKERVLAALRHQQPDRVPVDFGATAVTGIHCSMVELLRTHYGLDRRPVKIHEPYQMLGLVEDDLQQALSVDVEGALPLSTLFGFPPQDWKPWRTPWGQDVLVPGQFMTAPSLDGGIVIYPQGDTLAPPSGHMPEGGYFFDSIIRQQPIDDDHLDPADNLEEFAALSDADLDRIAANVRQAGRSGRAVLAGAPGTALGDIALVPAPFLKNPRGVRDVAQWYMTTALHPEFIRAVFERQVEIAIANLKRLNDRCGSEIDVVFVCGTDFGTQIGTFCSSQTFRDLWLPYYRTINEWIHRNTSWHTFKHSCGAVGDFIDPFIEAGFDILNPVQCSAAGMDPAALKRRFGDRITFWGGGVDTQKTLPFGSPEEVRREVLERLEIFAKGGGFVFNAIHNIQARTPVANVLAMIDALNEFAR